MAQRHILKPGPKAKDTTVEEGILRARYYVGYYTRIARRLKVSVSVVRRVANDLDRSERILRALRAEAQRIELQVARAVAKKQGSSHTFKGSQQ